MKVQSSRPTPFYCPDAGHTHEHRTHRRAAQAQDCDQVQTVPLCHVPELQPDTREDCGLMAFPAVFG